MPCHRTVHTSFVSVLAHGSRIGVLETLQVLLRHHVIDTELCCLRVLFAVFLLPLLLFLLVFPTFPGLCRYDGCMQVQRLLFHVQDCRNYIFLSESLTQTFQIVVAPVAKRFVRFYPLGYRLGTVVHSFGELNQSSVQMRTCFIRHVNIALHGFIVAVPRPFHNYLYRNTECQGITNKCPSDCIGT